MHLSIQLCGLLLYALVSIASSQEKERVWHSTVPGSPNLSDSDLLSPTSSVPPANADPLVAGPAGSNGPAIPEKVVADAESSITTPQLGSERESQDAQNVLVAEDKIIKETPKKEELLVEVEGKKEKKERKWMTTEDKIVQENPKKEELLVEVEGKKERKWMTTEDKTTQENPKKEETLVEVEGKNENKERKWMSAPEEVVKEEERLVKENVKGEHKLGPEQETGKESTVEESKTVPAEISNENVATKNSAEGVKPKNKKKPRKWMSVPGMAIEEEATFRPSEEDMIVANESLDLAQQAVEEKPLTPSESVSGQEIDPYAMNALDLTLPENITELLLAAEEGIPLVQEIIVSKKTTVYVTISDSIDAEPLYVNLTGIRHFTGQERRMMTGCLDLSDLMLTGEEAKEVIQRMSKHMFHRLDLSNNNITEFPMNTFSPVAFTVRELRLDGNPLASNDQGEASVLQRGGLFHLTELRELNLSSCGLQDMDYFTPWNSNHLEVVDLSNNKLSTVPSNLQFFHKLKKLFLDGNPITKVTELPFALLWNMQVLSMASCEIATIADDPFRNMDKLKELSLEGNNLTQIGHVRLPRSNSAVKMFISGNPWHCACEMLNFVEHYHYAIRDIEYIRCASPRWLEGLRTAYLTKEILSLDSIDGDCTPQSPRVSGNHHIPVPIYTPTLRTDRLQLLALIVFVLAALFMLCHVLWARKKDKYRFEDDRDDIHYIRIEKKPNFK